MACGIILLSYFYYIYTLYCNKVYSWYYLIGGFVLWIFDFFFRVYSIAGIDIDRISAKIVLEPIITKNGIIEICYRMYRNQYKSLFRTDSNNTLEKVSIEFLMGQYMYLNIPQIDTLAW